MKSLEDLNMDLQQRPEIAYLCDGKIERCQEIGCGVTQSGNFRECYHTSDINHAKNFRKLDDNHYIEVREGDNE